MDFIPTSFNRSDKGIMFYRKTIDRTTRKMGEKKLWVDSQKDPDLYVIAIEIADEMEAEGEA